ncbi:MAG: phosphoribosylaminoimidazolesuccinocarboxamide synthase [Thermoguttaceae bacterium]|nr:phosphoribosylaminoimidazolesuccinocarboxamide synthase [Thermoguttaceae bacterium]MDW8079537.1 phosphoribosylaminoimidazolesuccinocarboxamide synthase [Thermoguttaceae bacterium]
MPSIPVMSQSDIPGLPRRQGKVRDIYDFGDTLLLVSTDRISAFDWVLPTPIPYKGCVLNQLSAFWFEFLGVDNHLITTDVRRVPWPEGVDPRPFKGRISYVHKVKVIPVECVVRGYLSGSGWADYRATGKVCGIALPPGLRESDPLPEPIFTPATKAQVGHDENITFDQVVQLVGGPIAEELRSRSIALYRKGAAYAQERGIILADTKFEFGLRGDKLILVDEVLTPDSSRFWPADQYRPGGPQPSFDKQYVRDWLVQSGWDKNSPPPALPPEVVEKTCEKYLEAFNRLTGRTLELPEV